MTTISSGARRQRNLHDAPQGQELGPSARIDRKRERRWLAQLVAGNESQVYTLLNLVTTFVSDITDAAKACKTAQTSRWVAATMIEGKMFGLITTVRRGTACDLPGASSHYPTVEAARTAAATLLRDERVQRVMIVRNGLHPTYVEWAIRQ